MAIAAAAAVAVPVTVKPIGATTESIRVLLRQAIKTPKRFRYFVEKLTQKMNRTKKVVVDGNTLVREKLFGVIVKQIVLKVNKATVSPEVLKEVWLGACAGGADGPCKAVACGVLEVWLGLE